MSRWIQVPGWGSPTLRFWYRIVTYDRNAPHHDEYDFLDVEVAGERVLWAMKDAGDLGCDLPPEDMGWRMGEADLFPWCGLAIPIRFRLHTDGEYNTWVYIDDISVQ